MSIIDLNLDKLLPNDRVDSISGRIFGQGVAETERILDRVAAGDTFKIIISNKITFINDSFWKGFFKEIFKKLGSKSKLLEKFEFEANSNFIADIHENLDVLNSIYNS